VRPVVGGPRFFSLTALSVTLMVSSVIVLLVARELWFASGPTVSCPTSGLDLRIVGIGVALLMATVATFTSVLVSGRKATPITVAISASSACVCLVYVFLLTVLIFCAVPAAY
jgi:hypothetical protein